MDEAAEAFMDAWLDANVTHKHAKKPSQRTIRALANRCIQDATAAGISLDSLEEVVVDIEEAIMDELNFIATVKAKE
jgi:glucose-6-phosphate dehydrogenase assembly protein OpcA